MSTALSHLAIERGPMLSGAADSQTDAEMLEAAWEEAILEAQFEEVEEGWFEEDEPIPPEVTNGA